jgi:hypothetical protein
MTEVTSNKNPARLLDLAGQVRCSDRPARRTVVREEQVRVIRPRRGPERYGDIHPAPVCFSVLFFGANTAPHLGHFIVSKSIRIISFGGIE